MGIRSYIPLALLLALFLHPAAALASPALPDGGLRLETAYAEPASARPGPDVSIPGRFFLDLQHLYADPWTIGWPEAGIWLSATALLSQADAQTFAYIHSNLSTPEIERWSGFITKLGEGLAPLAITAMVWLDDREAGLDCLESMIFAGLNVQALKLLLGKARPYLGLGPVFTGPTLSADYESMPSGHTAVAFSLATVLAANYPRCKWLFYGGAALVGLSRIYLEMHWPSDVLAAAVIGIYAGQRVMGCEYTILNWRF